MLDNRNETPTTGQVAIQAFWLGKTSMGLLASIGNLIATFLHSIKHILRFVFTPMAMLLTTIDTLLTAHALKTAANKNITKWSKFITSAISSALFLTAMLGTLIASTAFVVVAPILLAVSAGISFIYNLWELSINAYKWATTPKDLIGLRNTYKENAKRALIKVALSAIGLALTIAFAVANISTPILSVVVSTIAFAMTAYAFVHLYKSYKRSKKIADLPENLKNTEENTGENTEEKPQNLLRHENSPLIINTQEHYNKLNPFAYTESTYVARQPITRENVESCKRELIFCAETRLAKIELEKEKENPWLKKFGLSEDKKRESKIQGLRALIAFLKTDPNYNPEYTSSELKQDCEDVRDGLISFPDFKIKYFNGPGVFQSFFAKEGGVESLATLAGDVAKIQLEIQLSASAPSMKTNHSETQYSFEPSKAQTKTLDRNRPIAKHSVIDTMEDHYLKSASDLSLSKPKQTPGKSEASSKPSHEKEPPDEEDINLMKPHG